MESFFKNKRRGIIGTGIFHIGLIVLLVVFGFRTPLPLPGEEGILVNFGTDDFGGPSRVEPSKPSKPVQQVLEKVTPPPPTPEPAAATPDNAEEAINTQDFEESAAVESAEEKKTKEPTPEEIEAERKRQEEIKRKQEEAAEKERLEQIERERLAEIERQKEQERLAKEEDQRKINEINSRFKNSFGQGNNDNENQSTGEGEGNYKGNQGVEHGSVDSNVHGQGQGLGTKGVSFSLKGRSSKILPKPVDKSQKEGIVVVEIRVNGNGDVISANPGVKGSTTLDEYLCKVAKEAALKAKFSEKPNAPDQIGSITYHFVLE